MSSHNPKEHPSSLTEDARYLEGIRLFNAGLFWESHEAWEEIWLDAEGIQAEYLQGLIQAAAALLKYHRNEPAPAKRLYETAMRRLSLCPDKYMGLDVRDFQRVLDKCFQPIIVGPYSTICDSEVPRITVS